MTEILVEAQPGATDSDKLAAACSKAIPLIPSTVVLPDRPFQMTRYQNLRLGVSLAGYGRTRSLVNLDFPGAAAPAGNSPFGFRVAGAPGHESRLEEFAIGARPTGYFRLITCLGAEGVLLRDLDFGVCGQSFVEMRGCSHVELVGCVGPYGGDNSFDGASSKYKLHFIDSTDVSLHGLTMGSPDHDRNQSFVTFNKVTRGRVAGSVFHGTKTYCLNTHGGGSREIVFEANLLHPGRDAKFGAILVGNEAWGADRDVSIRGNTMVGPGRFLEVREDSSVFLQGNVVPPWPEVEMMKVCGGGATVVMLP